MHVDEAVATGGVVPREQEGVGVADKPDVGRVGSLSGLAVVRGAAEVVGRKSDGFGPVGPLLRVDAVYGGLGSVDLCALDTATVDLGGGEDGGGRCRSGAARMR